MRQRNQERFRCATCGEWVIRAGTPDGPQSFQPEPTSRGTFRLVSVPGYGVFAEQSPGARAILDPMDDGARFELHAPYCRRSVLAGRRRLVFG